MKKYIFIITVFVLSACMSNSQKQVKQVFSISFACCFENDSVSLYINDSEIFKDIEMSSDVVVDLTWHHAVYTSDNRLLVYKNRTENVIYDEELLLNPKSFDIMTVINSDTVTKTINLSKGRNIVVNASSYNYMPEIRQYKKTVYLE